MNTKDNQFDQELDDLFEQNIPEANSNTKQSSIDLALAEFAKQNPAEETSEVSQGIANSTRPIGNRNTISWVSSLIQPIRSFLMSTPKNRYSYNAFATVAIAFVAVSVVYNIPSLLNSTKPEIVARKIDENNTPKINQSNQTKLLNDTKEEQVVVNTIDVVASRSTEHDQLASIIKNDIDRITSRKPVDKLLKAELNIPTPSTAAEGELQTMSMPESNSPSLQEIIVTGSRIRSPREKREAKKKQRMDQARSQMSSFIPSQPPGRENINQTQHQDNREEYAEYQTNTIKFVADEPVSTFSIDVDTASYSLIRNQLNNGYLPKPQAVRAEELINYFNYDYPTPKSKKQPFEPSISVFNSPWTTDKKLVHIGIKGYDIAENKTPDSNLVFLLDVSGSMNAANKLPLVKQSLSLLLDSLKPSDTVSIVVYAGAAGTVLEPTKVKEKQKIIAALQRLNAGGSTAGGAGIKLAYQLAEQNFDKDSVNRIILATDGDFNVGMKSNEDLKTYVERKRDSGVFLSILGFGRNNYQDDMMQTLAQNGNGIAAYIDTLSEAKKVLVDEATSMLFPIAKDVKIQVEFNPAVVSDYRLIGYETRKLNREDFNNDKVDAGDIGAGHTVTAIYEITPTNAEQQSVDESRYSQNKSIIANDDQRNEYGFVKIRYKLPNSTKSKLIEKSILVNAENEIRDAQFSIAVAGFAQLLANSKYTGSLTYDDVVSLAQKHKGTDPFGYRSEFIQLVRMAKIAQP